MPEHRKPCYWMLLLLIASGTLVPVADSTARTIAVPTDIPTIAQAAASADSGDVVLVSCGRYLETNIRLPNGVNIWSSTLQPGCVTIDGRGRGRVFVIEDCDSTTSLFGFTIIGGAGSADDGGGAVYLRDASPRIANCVIANNTAVRGGGIYCAGRSSPQIRSCTFRDNEATSEGGAIYWAGSQDGIIASCRFTDNLALCGGGLYVTGGTGLTVRDCRFTHNGAANSGGALAVVDAAPKLQNCVMAYNWGGLGGGGIICEDAAPILSHCTLHANGAEYYGGGLAYVRSVVRLDHCIIAFHALPAIDGEGRYRPELTSCNLYGNDNGNGDWTGVVAEQAALHDNFSRDPLFCAPNYDDFYLEANSWCLPENRPFGQGELVGALGRGCAESGTDSERGSAANRQSLLPPGPD